MDAAQVIDLGRESLWIAVLVAAATSIQEMTLSFIPKLAVMVLALVIFGGWQIGVMVDFFRRIFERIPTLFL
jgi:flagellar biosynthetic protein FliQ